MECLYAPDLTADSATIALSDDELQHARALRLREGEEIKLTNGIGLCARTKIVLSSKSEIICSIEELLPAHNELPYRTIVALGILDNRERMEFALEKAVELGASDFVPLLTQFSERDRTKPERLSAKALAAMKQSHRANLVKIHTPMSPEALLSLLPAETILVFADSAGAKPNTYNARTICLCVGPEGGFSEAERTLFLQEKRTVSWKLAQTRLRAETALLCGLSAINLFHH